MISYVARGDVWCYLSEFSMLWRAYRWKIFHWTSERYKHWIIWFEQGVDYWSDQWLAMVLVAGHLCSVICFAKCRSWKSWYDRDRLGFHFFVFLAQSGLWHLYVWHHVQGPWELILCASSWILDEIICVFLFSHFQCFRCCLEMA